MTYPARRLVLFALTLLLISVVTFAVTNILPGDVATMIMGTRGNPTSIAALQEKLGLNDPLIVQYGRWIRGMPSRCAIAVCCATRTGRSSWAATIWPRPLL